MELRLLGWGFVGCVVVLAVLWAFERLTRVQLMLVGFVVMLGLLLVAHGFGLVAL